MLTVSRLRCEHQHDPLGIDTLRPRLSWMLSADGEGHAPCAWQVLVATGIARLTEADADLWNSGKVRSGATINIEYQGRPLQPMQGCFWKVRVWDQADRVSDWSAVSNWEVGLPGRADWRGCWINDGRENPTNDADFYRDDPAPLMRRAFHLKAAIASARLYITSRGYYVASLNGRRVGDRWLDPGWTHYGKRVLYSTYDVTDMLQSGANCIGITLGNGWYNPMPLRMWGHLNLRERLAVGRPCVLAQLVVTHADRNQTMIVTDASWRVHEGPIRFNSIYLGERYDARREMPGWDLPGFDDRTWGCAGMSPEEALKPEVRAQEVPPIQVTRTLRPVAVSEPAPGTYIVDMGQNFAGQIALTLEEKPGTQIRLRYGELLHADGALNPLTSVAGQIKKEGTGGPGAPPVAWQEDTYIAKGGGPETYRPTFTWHAFRYVEITGLSRKPRSEDLLGLRMHSAVERVGRFDCSVQALNDIQEMCDWTFLSNMFSVQSDCPHRERFGYGGDIMGTHDAFSMNYDMSTFYAKAVRDWHDDAGPDGLLYDTAPSVGMTYCGLAWSLAHAQLQRHQYRYYGDLRLIEEQYATSARWLAKYVDQYPGRIVDQGLSDHESLCKGKYTSAENVTPFFAYAAQLLAEFAELLNRPAEARRYTELADEIRRAYASFLKQPSQQPLLQCQSSQVIALYHRMLSGEEARQTMSRLVEELQRDGHLSTGILATKYLLEMLSASGQAGLAFRLVTHKGFPGWLHMLERGATTLWEHWQESDNTYSHNHPMFGSVSQWFYNWLGGIQPHPEACGFDRIILQPQFIPGMDWVRCSYESIRGPVVCNWERRGDTIALEIALPLGATAQLILPGQGDRELAGGRYAMTFGAQ